MSTDLINCASGFTSGMSGVILSQPFYNYKLDRQKGQKTLWSFRCLFGGTKAAIACDPIGVAIQNSMFEKMKYTLGSPGAALLAGSFSAIPITMAEMTMDHHRQSMQQTADPSYVKTIRKMVQKNGPFELFRGLKCTMLREGINTIAWKMWSNEISEMIKPHISHPVIGDIAGSILSGCAAAFCSHPFDTAKVKLQNRITTGFLHSEILNILRDVYYQQSKEKGSIKAVLSISKQVTQEAFSGFVPRAGVLAIFLTTVNLSNPLYEKAYKSILE